jgi:hypothetical protein
MKFLMTWHKKVTLNTGDLMCWFDCNIEQFEDTKGVIRIRNLMKDRQHSDKMNKKCVHHKIRLSI